MAVIVANKRWTTLVPYVVGDSPILVNQCISEINEGAGRTILVEKKSDPPVAHLLISSGHGHSESIGYKAQQIKVSAASKRALIHEILHALGFCHEQFHRDFAWYLPEHDLKEATYNTKTYLENSKWNKRLAQLINQYLVKGPSHQKGKPQLMKMGSGGIPSKKPLLAKGGSGGIPSKQPLLAKGGSLGGKPSPKAKSPPVKKTPSQLAFAKSGGKKYQQFIKEAPELGAEQQFRSYLDCLSDEHIIVSDSCDYDSIMMYDELARAALETQNEFGAFIFTKQPVGERKLTGDDRGLSKEDKEALQEYIVPEIRRVMGRSFSVGPDKNGKF